MHKEVEPRLLAIGLIIRGVKVVIQDKGLPVANDQRKEQPKARQVQPIMSNQSDSSNKAGDAPCINMIE